MRFYSNNIMKIPRSIHTSKKSLISTLILLSVSLCKSFNLEDRLPLIKKGPTGSLFGLSVAEHYITPTADSLDDITMLVGAPTNEAAPHHSEDSVNPGALYKCPITANSKDCEAIVIDDSINTLEINNSNQWLGVTVKTQKPGGKVVVCAHRFTIRGGGSSRGIVWEAEVGRCFLLGSDLNPVINNAKQWTPCIGKLDPDGAYSPAWYGYCQAGTSVAFADNKGEDLVFGMPGPFHWTGGLNIRELSAEEFFPAVLWTKDSVKGQIPQNSYLGMVHTVSTVTEGWFSNYEKTWISESNLRLKADPVPQNSYLGFSLATGRLTASGDEVNFVSGAPRSNDTGMVVIFEKKNSNGGLEKILEKTEILYGEKLASSFGYAVEIVDINGDDREDLIIGAPQYYDRKEKKGGAVYIYINKGLDKIGPTPTKILYGELDSFFGNSITNMGDINMDGANDVAIGAPGDEHGAGVVYIYHGTNDPNEGVFDEPAQVLRAKNLTESGRVKRSIKGFGYSLSGGMDMDLNEYPDLMVGTLSDMIVLYRTRPIVNVQASIKASLTKVVINPEVSKDTTDYINKKNETVKLVTYDLSVCMNYTALPQSYNKQVNIEYTVQLDSVRVEAGFRTRAMFRPLDPQSGSKTSVMTLPPQQEDRSSCATWPVYLAHDIQDKLSPIVMSVVFNVKDEKIPHENETTGLISVNQFPVLNTELNNTTQTSVNISKDCGPDEICRSNLALHANYVVLLEGNKKWTELKNGENGIPLLLLGTEKEIGMRIAITNFLPGEGAHQAKLKIVLPPELRYVGTTKVVTTAATVSCTTLGNASVVDCNLGNPMRPNSELSMIVKLENDPALYSMDSFIINMQMSTSSTQSGLEMVSYPVFVRVEAQIKIDGYSNVDQIPFGGDVVGESAVDTPLDAGLYVNHDYEITNTGTSEIDGVYVNISWPQLISNGKWLFYLLDAQVYGNDLSNETKCFLPEETANPLNLKYVEPSADKSRRRRETDVEPADSTSNEPALQPVIKPPTSTYKILKCPESAKCLNFVCTLGRLYSRQKVFINLKGVVWNSTFLEEYYGVAEVRVYSSAYVGVSKGNVQYAGSSVLETEVATSILAEEVIIPTQDVKLWIIVVATLSGVLLLIIIVLVLWRCGFFERQRFYSDVPTHKARRSKNVKDNKAVSQKILQHQSSWQTYSD